MTETNQRDDDAYYDTYDEDIAAGRAKPVRTTHRVNPGARVSDDELDAIFRGRPNLGEAHATGAGRSPARHVRFQPQGTVTRAALVTKVLQREMRRWAALRDAVVLREQGAADDLDELVAWMARNAVFDD